VNFNHGFRGLTQVSQIFVGFSSGETANGLSHGIKADVGLRSR
jgi:hypothetical protein